MKTLYVTDHAARIRVRKANLVVERSHEGTRVPIETLEAVVLLGRAELTNAALGELTRRGVRVAALSKSGRLRFCVGGPIHGNVHLRVGQYEASRDLHASLEIAKLLVAGKLENCRRLMQRWEWDARSSMDRDVIRRHADGIAAHLAAISTARDGDTVRGIEGAGTRRYFRAMAVHLHTGQEMTSFERRSRRPPRDPVNALLSFTYGLVLTSVVGSLEAVGLDPQIGFLHRPRSGRPSLGLDLLEEMRASIADRLVVAVLRRRQMVEADFERGAGKAVYLSDEGRRKFLKLYDQNREEQVVHPLLQRPVPIAMLPSVQATLMARHLRGDLPVYPPYTIAA